MGPVSAVRILPDNILKRLSADTTEKLEGKIYGEER